MCIGPTDRCAWILGEETFRKKNIHINVLIVKNWKFASKLLEQTESELRYLENLILYKKIHLWPNFA